MKFLFFLLLSCCSTHQQTVPKELQKYSDLFRNKILTTDKMRERLNKVEFELEYLKDYNYVGECYPITWRGNPKVIINMRYFNKSSEINKISDIMHELGHCVCHLAHTEESGGTGLGDIIEKIFFRIGFLEKKNDLYDGCPSSIMYPVEFSDKCFMEHEEYYYEELKNRCI